MDKTRSEAEEEVQPAEILREYGPFDAASRVHGVTYDGANVWFAGGETLQAFDPVSGAPVRTLDVPCDAGTAFDGRHLFQLGEGVIRKIDPGTGQVLKVVPAPGHGNDSGLTWAEGFLWVGQFRGRVIHQIDPETGAVLRTIESKRFVTGVTWVEGELWHGTAEGDSSDIRRIDPKDGRVLVRLTLPEGMTVTGLESDGGDIFYAGGGPSRTVRAVKRPRRPRR
ncbi:glutaminyl-peptide cyclotransferase [Myxococcus sp. K15C18031901]|uniref:Vgb family protein n=1 Tax=Myxococcus dinghuensis TaxID=2906761 RepID=UPI0020A7567D|nr:glutaminyl-peptide cyclotransferase [Myxococcus dinghuensis]MCP3097301.1 glutaminyl-peptide cyclotransferase [Myxococcus dinghuensis]